MSKKINIGLIGLGNVGSALYNMLQKEPERFQVLRIAVRDKNKSRKTAVSPDILTENANEIIFNPHIDVIVDASNDNPENIFERITHQKEIVPKVVLKHYILASKKTMAFYGEEVLKFAKENNIGIGFEATVCAGIPIVRILREGHVSEKIIEVGGILNGTTNYILSQMFSGVPYSWALRKAQQLGYAEANPTEDISGLDAACKLIILCGLCFGKWPKMEEVKIKGIECFEKSRHIPGHTNCFKLVASAKLCDNSLELKVRPCICGGESDLGIKLREAGGVGNLVYIKTELRELYFNGPGAGGEVTAAAMMSDLSYIAQKLR